jgi:hypothetical protein
MTTSIDITQHAQQRITERIEPLLGNMATDVLTELVLDAEWNQRYRRRGPKWLRSRLIARGENVRYVTGRVDDVRIACVVSRELGTSPVMVTVITDAERPVPALPAVPELPDGRVIGTRRIAALPVAFSSASAVRVAA